VIAYRAVGRELRFRHVIQRLASSHPPQEVLTDILRSVRSIHPCNGAIIYYADYQERRLVSKAYIAPKDVDHDKCKDLSYLFNEHSFATFVLNNRGPEFSNSPAQDKRVNQKGIEAFKIDGPLAGLPLIFQDKVVGVLVVWTSADQTPLDQSNIGILEPFARLAAANIAMSSQQDTVLRSIEVMLQLIQTELSLQNKLELILSLVKEAGFDRVRVFRFDRDTNSFLPVTSLPKDNPENFPECVIPIEENPFAKDTHDDAHLNPSARIYDQSRFGVDPHSRELGKPEDLPWVVIPLVIAGKLYGQIAADNAERRQPIPRDSLPYLTLLGTFAALAIANTRVFERMSLPSLYRLYSDLPEDAPELTYIQRLLVYLTCGEALGFSRALFLRFDGHRKRLKYMTGLGSITQEDFIRIGKIAEREGIERIMAKAGNLRDVKLEEAMQDFAVNASDPAIRDLIQETEARRFTFSEEETVPAWLHELKKQIEAVDILAAPVRVNGKLAGLFLVDRQWLNEAISEADRVVLGAFANQAGVFLHSFSLRQEAIHQLRRAVRNEANSFAYHRIKNPISVIEARLRLFDDYMKTKEVPKAIGVIRGIRHEIRCINQIIDESLKRGEFVSKPTPLEPIFRDALSQAKAEGIRCNIICEKKIKVEGDRRFLKECFEELVANARYWTPKPHGFIEISANLLAPSDGEVGLSQINHVSILVKNTGDGVSDEKKKWIFVDGNFTREGGNGRGLARVSDIIKAHGGTIAEIGEFGKFALFDIILPLA
jgi:signal transduction histidine kinase/GAF domain-containing protein